MVIARALLVVMIAASGAAAQKAAAPEEESRAPHALGGAGITFGAGPAWQNASTGWMLRLEYEAFPAMPRNGEFGAMFGFIPGFEYWQDGREGMRVDKGFSIPWAIVAGVRAPGMRVLVGTGINLFTLDSVDGDLGVGSVSPMGVASAYVDVRGLRVGADLRVVRRWQLGADDFTQVQLMFSIGATMLTPRPSSGGY